MLKSIFVRFFFQFTSSYIDMVLNLRWGTGAWVQDRHHFPSIDPHLCFEFLQFFLFIMDPWFNISDKNYIIMRNLSGTNMYICMWSFFARYSSFYIIHCVHDKINNYYYFFFSKYWNLTQQNYCANYIKSRWER